MLADNEDHGKCLSTETVEGTAGALKGVDNVEGSDGLPINRNNIVSVTRHNSLHKTTNLFACSV